MNSNKSTISRLTRIKKKIKHEWPKMTPKEEENVYEIVRKAETLVNEVLNWK